jgi:serine/threonine protein kinase
MAVICHNCGFHKSGGATSCTVCSRPLHGGAPPAIAHAPRTDRPGLPPGSLLQGGRYALGRVLGEGGFGITYLGSDVRLARPVAVKEFFLEGCERSDSAVSPPGWLAIGYGQALAEFLSEARRLARFRHPSIVATYDFFEENGTAYAVMEHLHGKTLAQLVEGRGPLPEAEALGYVKAVAGALEAMHREGLLHLDVKPDNVMACDDGRVVLIDFGLSTELANVAGAGTRQLTIASRFGTPGYAPLEQYAEHSRLCPASDVHALAATLYHLLTGQVPTDARHRRSLSPPDARHVRPEVSEGVSGAIARALETDIYKRPQSIQAFLSALAAGPAAMPSPAPTPRAPRPPAAAPRQLPWPPSAPPVPRPSWGHTQGRRIRIPWRPHGRASQAALPVLLAAALIGAAVGMTAGRYVEHGVDWPAGAIGVVAGLLVAVSMLRSSGADSPGFCSGCFWGPLCWALYVGGREFTKSMAQGEHIVMCMTVAVVGAIMGAIVGILCGILISVGVGLVAGYVPPAAPYRSGRRSGASWVALGGILLAGWVAYGHLGGTTPKVARKGGSVPAPPEPFALLGSLNLGGRSNDVRSVAFSPDGKKVVSVNGDRTAWLWDAQAGRLIRRIAGGKNEWVLAAAFSPTGKAVAVGMTGYIAGEERLRRRLDMGNRVELRDTGDGL